MMSEKALLPNTVPSCTDGFYPPSWTNRLFRWLQRRSFPAWLFYFTAGMVLYLVLEAAQWSISTANDRSATPSQWALYVIYYLALMHYLDGVAKRALAAFRPALTVSDDLYALLQYELTTLPARKARIAGLAGAVLSLISMVTLPGLQTTPAHAGRIQIVLGIGVAVLGNAIFSICLYHSYRQLGIVKRIHSSIKQFSLFRREPLYAFSALTTRTGAAYVLALWFGLAPKIGASNIGYATAIVADLAMILFAVAAFFVPLVSIRQLLVREKRHELNKANVRLETLMSELYGRIDEKDLKETSQLKSSIDSLLAVRDVVNKTPTWPWKTDTLVGFLSAFSIPLIVWITQQLLSRLIGP